MYFLILSGKSVLPENRLFSFNAAFFFVTSHSAKVSASSKRTCRSEILLLPFCNKLANLKEEEGEKEPKNLPFELFVSGVNLDNFVLSGFFAFSSFSSLTNDFVPNSISTREGPDFEGQHGYIARSGLEFIGTRDFRGELNLQ